MRISRELAFGTPRCAFYTPKRAFVTPKYAVMRSITDRRSVMTLMRNDDALFASAVNDVGHRDESGMICSAG